MLLAKYDRIYADPFESVDIYTKQCSVGVNATQLARMGAVHHVITARTRRQASRVIKVESVPFILSTMTMAGLYEQLWFMGLASRTSSRKTGVGGGIVAVVPGKGAIAVFAPRLDEAGNSVKAQKVIEYVADKLDYNLFSLNSVGLSKSRTAEWAAGAGTKRPVRSLRRTQSTNEAGRSGQFNRTKFPISLGFVQSACPPAGNTRCTR